MPDISSPFNTKTATQGERVLDRPYCSEAAGRRGERGVKAVVLNQLHSAQRIDVH